MAISHHGRITLAEISEAYQRIRPFVNLTPVLTSSTFNSMSGLELFFKCENFQKTGAFKVIKNMLNFTL